MKPDRSSTAARPACVRTSNSHPLQIAELHCGPAGGTLGVTFCPGKQGDSVFGEPWQRSLSLDLDVIQAWGARIIVTLVETHELAMLGVADLEEQVQHRHMMWQHLPIRDLQPPGAAFESEWPTAARTLCQTLSAGDKVLVHCRGGLGRAGTVAALLLVEMGVAPADAIRRVREVRPRAIETAAQERYVLNYSPYWSHLKQK